MKGGVPGPGILSRDANSSSPSRGFAIIDLPRKAVPHDIIARVPVPSQFEVAVLVSITFPG
jgi:hypothetical protein